MNLNVGCVNFGHAPRRAIMLLALLLLAACKSDPGGELGPAAGAPQPSATIGDGMVSITWESVPNASRYRLYFLSGANAAAQVTAPVQEVSSPAIVDGLQNGRNYYLALTSVSAGGESEYSAVMAVAPRPAPVAPQDVSASAALGAISLAWSSVPTADAYRVYVAPSEDVVTADVRSAPALLGVRETNAPSYTEQNLINGREYSFVVTAVNSSGESVSSTVINATPGPYKSLSAGAAHTCAVDADDAMWCWGSNWWGQLDGVPTPDFTATPRHVTSNTKWAHASAGATHTCGVGLDASLQCWGNSSPGVMPLSIAILQPVILHADQWLSLSGGYQRSCATRGDGALRCWGVGRPDSSTMPLAVIGRDVDWLEATNSISRACARKRDGSLWCMDWPVEAVPSAPRRVDGVPSLVKVSANGMSTQVCAIDAARKLWCWDEIAGDPRGQLGRGTVTADAQPARVASDATWSDVTVGADHACGVQQDGSLWCWGANDYGQLGIDARVDQLSPVRTGADSQWSRVVAGARHTCAMKQDGSLWCVGRNELGQLGTGSSAFAETPQRVLGDVVSVETGSTLACAILGNGQTWCWGRFAANDESYPSAVAVPLVYYAQSRAPVLIDDSRLFTRLFRVRGAICGVAADGALWCWGDGMAATTADAFTPRRIAGASDWERAVVRGTTACTIGSPSVNPIASPLEIWCASGSLREDFAPTVPDWKSFAIGLIPWRELSSGAQHTCALNDASEVWCWGQNDHGQIGAFGALDPVPAPVKITGDRLWRTVATGSVHSCAIALDNTLWCWGGNADGQSNVDLSIDQLYIPTQVGADADWLSVSASFQRTCATKLDGTLWCMGLAPSGTFPAATAPRKIEALHEIRRVEPGVSWARGVPSRFHNCALTTDRTLYCWGMNDQGQLGNGQAWITEWLPVKLPPP